MTARASLSSTVRRHTSVVRFLGLFSIYLLAVKPILSLPMSSSVLLTAQIILGIGALIVPLVVYSAIDRAWWKSNVSQVAKQWCASAGLTFKRAELHKNHCTAIAVQNQCIIRRRFRMSRYFLFWKVKETVWLDSEAEDAQVCECRLTNCWTHA